MEDHPSYDLVKELGSGSFGYVFLAIQRQTGKKVAIKRIEKVGKQLSREYEVLKDIQSSNHCVKMLDCFYTKNEKDQLVQNMVFEFIEDDLERLIKRHRANKAHMYPFTIKYYGYQIFKGLEDLAAKNIVHRDLKPENVLKGAADVIKIADFGSSKFLDNSSINTPYIVSRYYRAPELLLCLTSYTQKIDVWAAGCILAELILLEPMFKGRTEGDQLFTIFRSLGGPSAEDYKFYARNVPFISKYFSKFPDYKKDTAVIENLARRFSDKNVVIDFFEKIFKYNPTERPTASELLSHPFFDEVRSKYANAFQS